MYLRLKLQASLALREIDQKLQYLPDSQSDYQKKINAVKKGIKKTMNIWEILISESARNVEDYTSLLNSDPVFIVNYYKSRILSGT